MRSFQAVLLIHFLKIVSSGNFQNIHKTARIDNMNRIGKFVRIGPYVEIGPHSEIGDFTNIAANVLITNGSIIGEFCNINEGVSVINNVRVYNHVNIGRNTFLRDNCKIGNFVKIGSNANILKNVQIYDHSSSANNVSIGAGSVIDRHSNIFYASQIGSNVYVGDFVTIGENAVIGDNAVIYKFAFIRIGMHVLADEIIIQTPSSASLYRDSLSLEHIKQFQIDTILKGNDASVNNLLLDLMKQQLDLLNEDCSSAFFDILKLVKSLYLLKCHGRTSYENNLRQQQFAYFGTNFINYVHSNGQSFINGQDVHQILSRELHFGSNDNRNILNDEAKDHMIRLLAIENDNQRNGRVQGDTYCKMVENIKTKRRTVKCDT